MSVIRLEPFRIYKYGGTDIIIPTESRYNQLKDNIDPFERYVLLLPQTDISAGSKGECLCRSNSNIGYNLFFAASAEGLGKIVKSEISKRQELDGFMLGFETNGFYFSYKGGEYIVKQFTRQEILGLSKGYKG